MLDLRGRIHVEPEGLARGQLTRQHREPPVGVHPRNARWTRNSVRGFFCFMNLQTRPAIIRDAQNRDMRVPRDVRSRALKDDREVLHLSGGAFDQDAREPSLKARGEGGSQIRSALHPAHKTDPDSPARLDQWDQGALLIAICRLAGRPLHHQTVHRRSPNQFECRRVHPGCQHPLDLGCEGLRLGAPLDPQRTARPLHRYPVGIQTHSSRPDSKLGKHAFSIGVGTRAASSSSCMESTFEDYLDFRAALTSGSGFSESPSRAR